MKKFLLVIFLFALIFYNFFYVKDYLETIKETTYLWFTVLVPAVLPMYVISNFLINIPNTFKLFYFILKPFYQFENVTSAMLFILSFLTSNPTTTILIKQSLQNKLISTYEANRLMRSTSHFSFIFIYLVVPNYFLIIFSSLFLASSLIYRFSFKKQNNQPKEKITNQINYYNLINNLIDNGFEILLKILYIMLIVGFLSDFICQISPFKSIRILTAFFEVTIGTNYLKNFVNNILIKLLLILLLFSFNGLSTILQTLNAIKNDLSVKNFLVFRLIHMLLSSIIFLIFWAI